MDAKLCEYGNQWTFRRSAKIKAAAQKIAQALKDGITANASKSFEGIKKAMEASIAETSEYTNKIEALKKKLKELDALTITVLR